MLLGIRIRLLDQDADVSTTAINVRLEHTWAFYHPVVQYLHIFASTH